MELVDEFNDERNDSFMKPKLLLIAALMCAGLTGCVSGKGWQGLIPDKDVEIINPIITVMTPYGQQTLRADRIATRVNPAGTNPLPPLNNKPPVVVTGPALVTPR